MYKSGYIVSLLILFQNFVKLLGKSESIEMEIEVEIKNILKNRDHLEHIINPDIDPCQNFIDFVCGKYTSDQNYAKSPSSEIIVKNLLDNVANNKLEENIRNFYTNCNNKETNYFIEELKYNENWPATKTNWLFSDTDWIQSRLRESPLKPFIEIKLQNDYAFITLGNQINSDNSEIRNSDEINAIHDIMLRLSIDAEDAVQLKTEIVEFSKIFNRPLENVSVVEQSWLREYDLLTLKKDLPAINWEKYFAKYDDEMKLGKYKIIMMDQLRTHQYLNSIAKDPRVAYNYFFWKKMKHDMIDKCLKQTNSNFLFYFIIKYMEYYDPYNQEKFNALLGRLSNSVITNVKYHKDLAEEDITLFVSRTKARLEEINNSSILILEKFYENIDMNIENIEKFYKIRIDSSKLQNNANFLGNIFNEKSASTPFYADFPKQIQKFWSFFIESSRLIYFEEEKRYNISNCLINQRRESIFYASIYLYDFEYHISLLARILNLSYQEYLNLLNEKSNEWKLKDIFYGTNLSGEKAFFINYLNDVCTDSLNEKIFITHLLRNSDEFSQAFNCRKGTFMNPVKKCS